ncbi:MAG: hypothetical protein OQK56_02000 [Ignavibacteriaceae bacterium]|jgi:hypothetical protein|nr:hypothetical protein [Ignavibacteriaceae bacterium]MCW9065002.1 hypothetical protein [Ignavibacteriaceae bacterium]
MKKGCFIQSVVIVTILIAVVVYIIKYKLDDWLVKPSKELILTELSKNWDKETAYIKESVEKDSLKSLMNYYLENIKTIKEVVNLDEDIFLNELEISIEDSLITDGEISKLTLLMKKELYEKSKSN